MTDYTSLGSISMVKKFHEAVIKSVKICYKFITVDALCLITQALLYISFIIG